MNWEIDSIYREYSIADINICLPRILRFKKVKIRSREFKKKLKRSLRDATLMYVIKITIDFIYFKIKII